MGDFSKYPSIQQRYFGGLGVLVSKHFEGSGAKAEAKAAQTRDDVPEASLQFWRRIGNHVEIVGEDKKAGPKVDIQPLKSLGASSPAPNNGGQSAADDLIEDVRTGGTALRHSLVAGEGCGDSASSNNHAHAIKLFTEPRPAEGGGRSCEPEMCHHRNKADSVEGTCDVQRAEPDGFSPFRSFLE